MRLVTSIKARKSKHLLLGRQCHWALWFSCWGFFFSSLVDILIFLWQFDTIAVWWRRCRCTGEKRCSLEPSERFDSIAGSTARSFQCQTHTESVYYFLTGWKTEVRYELLNQISTNTNPQRNDVVLLKHAFNWLFLCFSSASKAAEHNSWKFPINSHNPEML